MFENYDPNDLANGYYPHLRKVSVYSADWQDLLGWFSSKGIPSYNRLEAPKGTDPVKNEVKLLPTNMVWVKNGSPHLALDAALVYNFPHVALVELKHYFGVGDPNVLEMYPGIREKVEYVEFSPIGAAWPEKGEGAFRPTQFDKFPYDAVYTDKDGVRYRKVREEWAFISYGVWRKIG